MQSINYVTFNEGEGPEVLDESSPEVKAARTAHILVGHPKCMLRLLSSAPSLCLDGVKVLVVDDLEASLHSPPPQDSAANGRGPLSPGSASPMEDVVQIATVLEC